MWAEYDHDGELVHEWEDEPTEADEDFLTQAQAGYIGYSKPQINYESYLEADNDPASPEQAWA